MFENKEWNFLSNSAIIIIVAWCLSRFGHWKNISYRTFCHFSQYDLSTQLQIILNFHSFPEDGTVLTFGRLLSPMKNNQCFLVISLAMGTSFIMVLKMCVWVRYVSKNCMSLCERTVIFFFKSKRHQFSWKLFLFYFRLLWATGSQFQTLQCRTNNMARKC